MTAPDVPDWTRVVLLSGIDPSGDPITIAVDANGYIVAIMKGEYAGTLKNVAVDSEGRMIMIPTDPADVWGNAISMGNAELAARLSLCPSLFRTGNVMEMYSFEEGLRSLVLGGAGTLNQQLLSSSEARSGGLSLKLVGGSTDLLNAWFNRTVTYSVLSKVGYEVSISHNTDVDYYIIQMILYDGTDAHYAAIKYDETNKKVQYYTSTPAWVDLIASYNLSASLQDFNTFKLVADFVNDKYHKLFIGATEVDMSAYGLYKTLSGGGYQIEIWVYVYSRAGFNGIVHVDNYIITQNEPA